MDFKEIMDAFAADAGMTEPVVYEEENARQAEETSRAGLNADGFMKV